MLPDTIGKLFFHQAERLGEKIALRYKQLSPEYHSMSWTDFSTFVEEIAFGLASLPINAQQTVAIFSPTSYLWVSVDLAIMSIGAISVPIYPNSSSKDIEYILDNCEAEAIFVASEPLLSKLASLHDKIGRLKKIIYLPNLNKTEPDWEAIKSKHETIKDRLIHLNELCTLGRDHMLTEPEVVKNRLAASAPEDMATIIYTSGTTGTPKGVLLTQLNIVSVLHDLAKVIPVIESDIYLSYLPISHVFERICGEFLWLYSGCMSAFAESIESMAKNLNEVDPTIMLTVPRVLDRIYTKVKNSIEAAPSHSRYLIEWAIGVGQEKFDIKAQGKSMQLPLKLKYWLADSLVLQKLRQRIGKRLRFLVSGGAPATVPVLSFFNAIGIPAIEGYGLTETAAPTNVNLLERVKLGTVGPALPSIEMKLAADGEILVKGPSISQGYLKDEEATQESFTDGWFHTGDVGVIDKDGYLQITDRKKDLIVNAAGKNIAPQHIESVLRTIPHVSQALVFGDKRKYLVALITMDEKGMKQLAREKGWNCDKLEDIFSSKELNDYLKKEISLCRSQLCEYELIKRFAILDHELSVESGELTATLKVKRNVVAQKYTEIIEKLYEESDGSGSPEPAPSAVAR